MQITIDTKTDSHDDLRSAAAFLLHIVGDLSRDDEEAPAPKAPTAPSAATAPAIASSVAPVAVNVPPPPAIVPPATVSSVPPPPSVPVGTNSDEGEDETDTPNNVVQGNFSQPSQGSVPPPPPVMTPIVVGAAEVPNASVTLASTNGPSGVDSAGMPYDVRIHQKTGNKKKDGTWKLIKGIDDAVVAAVTAELAARKGAVAPVSLPPPNTVPMPPIPHGAGAGYVPAPPATPSVPVPSVAAVGAVGANGPSFRELIDKITAATKANQITPQRVAEVCQMHGAPNLMQLNAMPHLIADVSSSIDAVIAGLG